MQVGTTRPAILASAALVLAGFAGEIAQAGLPPEPPQVVRESPLAPIVREQGGGKLTEPEVQAVATAVEEEAARHGMDPLRVLAVIAVESRYNARAVSGRGARGLMQIKPVTFAWLREQTKLPGPRMPNMDHGYDVRLGVRYLAMMERRFGNKDRALMAYNAGPAKLLRMLRRGKLPPSLTVYPRAVNREYERLLALYAPEPAPALAWMANPRTPRG